MTASRSSRVVVVGGGAIGLCAAYALRKRDHNVFVVDAAPVHGSATEGNAGLITPSHVIPLAAPGMPTLGLRHLCNRAGPFGIAWRRGPRLWAWLTRFGRACTPRHVDRSVPVLHRLGMDSRRAWIQLLDDTRIECGMAARGLTMVCRTERVLAEEQRLGDRAASLGQRVQTLSPEDVHARFPSLGLRSVGGVHFQEDMHLSPDRFQTGLTGWLATHEVEFVSPARAVGWRRRSTRLEALVTDRGEVEGDHFLVAAGLGSQALLAQAGLSLPLESGKGYSLTLDNPSTLPSSPALLVDARLAITPMQGRLRVAGTMELGDRSPSINRRRVDGLRRAFSDACRDVPADLLEAASPWMGFRPCSPDGLPFIGPTRAADNLFVATGHAMIGLSLAPITGDLIADCIDGHPLPPDIARAVAVERWG